jgi:hypothetical protein
MKEFRTRKWFPPSSAQIRPAWRATFFNYLSALTLPVNRPGKDTPMRKFVDKKEEYKNKWELLGLL